MKLPIMHMLIRQKSPPIPRNVALWTFGVFANSVLNKGKCAIQPLFNDPEVSSFASDEAKLFAKNCSKTSDLDDSCISLLVFPSRTNLKQHSRIIYIFLV